MYCDVFWDIFGHVNISSDVTVNLPPDDNNTGPFIHHPTFKTPVWKWQKYIQIS